MYILENSCQWRILSIGRVLCKIGPERKYKISQLSAKQLSVAVVFNVALVLRSVSQAIV